ncbi:helix-turn-helix transcriptional regulator [Spirillospora sp. NPDC052269]
MGQGAALRMAREAAGISLDVMAKRTTYSKSALSMFENGKRPVHAQVVQKYEEALGLDVGRLAHVLGKPRKVDAASLVDLADALSATRRLEDAAGPTAVLPMVRGLAGVADTLAEEAGSPLRKRALALASEVSQYQGWVELESTGRRNATRRFTKAVRLAKVAGDPDREALGLSFHAYTRLEAHDCAGAADLAEAALQVRGTHPMVHNYDLFQTARIRATAGEKRQAVELLKSADREAEAGEDLEPPDFAYWYGSGVWALQRARVLGVLGETSGAIREIEAGLAALPPEQRDAEWASNWVQLTLDGGIPETRAP